MKNQTIFLFLFALVTLTISCTKNDDSEPTVENLRNFTDCELNTDPEFNGICLNGSNTASQNEVLTFASKSSAVYSEILWTVESGNIEILEVENSVENGINKSIATLKFNFNFSGGEIKVISTNNNGEFAGIDYTIGLGQQ
jgi:hypothetical protein